MRVYVSVCTDLLREKLNNNNFCFLHHAALPSSRDYEEARRMLEGEVNNYSLECISGNYLLMPTRHYLLKRTKTGQLISKS